MTRQSRKCSQPPFLMASMSTTPQQTNMIPHHTKPQTEPKSGMRSLPRAGQDSGRRSSCCRPEVWKPGKTADEWRDAIRSRVSSVRENAAAVAQPEPGGG